MCNITAITLLTRGCGWPLRLVAIAVVLGLALMRASTRADDFAAELPRVPPLDAVAAIASLRVQPEFKIQLAADESLLASPVAIAWDEDGRLFVAEMRGYSERQGERLGRVRLLHDDNDDGIIIYSRMIDTTAAAVSSAFFYIYMKHSFYIHPFPLPSSIFVFRHCVYIKCLFYRPLLYSAPLK